MWLPVWLDKRYSDRKTRTLEVYSKHWRRLQRFLEHKQITCPRQVLYRHISEYVEWRTATASKNMAIHELKFLSVVMGEAMRRGFVTVNPCVKMGLRKKKPEEKRPWTDAEAAKVAGAIGKQPHWMQCTFLLGYYQAARLRQIPLLEDIDFERKRITYAVTKGDKPFTHSMDPSIVQPLQKLTHHGLRVTWITRACLNGVHISNAKRFVNHGSTIVHEVYQRLSADDVEGVPDQVALPKLKF